MASYIKYEWENGRFLWPITFDYENPSHVRAICQEPDGKEKRLRQGTDFQIRGDNLIYVLPKDNCLIIWKEENQSAGNLPAEKIIAPQFQIKQNHCQTCCENHSQTLQNALADPAITQAISNAQAIKQVYQTPDILLRTAGIAEKTMVQDFQPLASNSATSQVQDFQPAVQSLASQPLPTSAQIQPAMAMASLVNAIPETVSAGDFAAGANSNLSGNVNGNNVNLVENSKIAELEARLDALISQRQTLEADALALARQREADAQVQSLIQTGQEQQASLATMLKEAMAEIQINRELLAKEMANRTAAIAESLELAKEAREESQAQITNIENITSQAFTDIASRLENLESRLIIASENASNFAREAETKTENARVTFANIENQATAATLALASSEDSADAAARSAQQAQASAQNAATSASNAQYYAEQCKKTKENASQEYENFIGQIATASDNVIAGIQDEARAQTSAMTNEARKLREDSVNVWNTAVKAIENISQTSNSSCRELWQKAANNIASDGAAQVNSIQNVGARTLEKARVAEQQIVTQGQAYAQVIADARIRAQSEAEFAQAEAARHQSRANNFAVASLELAQCAWDAARHASLANARPGIASVRTAEDLQYQVSGVYFINPKLPDTTPFMGVYPVTDFADANFDGVFFLGVPYPDTPAQPALPVYPNDPTLTPGMQSPAPIPLPTIPSNSGNWLPCDHGHCACGA